MTTTFGELKRKVLLRMKDKTDGKTQLAVEEAINDAQKIIACVRDFDELMTLDTANATTVANQSTYDIDSDFSLTRPKDIYSIRYMDESNSRKLDYIPLQELDKKIPYPEQLSTGKPSWYTIRGRSIQLIRIPDANKSLYIQHSQWPLPLANDTDQVSYRNIDHVIIALSVDIAYSIVEGTSADWFQRAQQLLGIVVGEDMTRPDVWHVARPFNPCAAITPLGQYWLNPWVKEQPE